VTERILPAGYSTLAPLCRSAAAEPRPIDLHAARVAIAGGQFAEAHQRVGIAVLAEVGENRRHDFALVERV
jgi:hypothetical protein